MQIIMDTDVSLCFQIELVRCLEFGLVSKVSARECVRALTVCCLEMHDVMIGQVYHVLLQLSKIAATVAMAIPLMEFLSGEISPSVQPWF